MKLATSKIIKSIDDFAVNNLKIPAFNLMERSGAAVAKQVEKTVTQGSKVLILAGGGNNGGDGYCTAALLAEKFSVTVCDVFSSGQRTEEGICWLKKAESRVKIIYGITEELKSAISTFDCIVDGVFGVGFHGELPYEILPLITEISASKAKKIAIDIPLGVNGDDGSVCDVALKVDYTLALSYIKPGLVSYPAKEYVGEIILDKLDIPEEIIESQFEFLYQYVDMALAKELLPKREKNTHKGSFGKCGLIVGSDKYSGAAILSLEGALRGGVGIVKFISNHSICTEARAAFPEAIYLSSGLDNCDNILEEIKDLDSLLIGSGSSVSIELFRLLEKIIPGFDGQLILDADALNTIASFSTPEIFKRAKHPPIITPHPKELSRLCGVTVKDIEKRRIDIAKEFARKYSLILLLKGAATIVTEGKECYINSSGSSALAKGGSGDVLAGLITSLCAFAPSKIQACALGAYLHGIAAQRLAKELSDFGVIPSDLPKEIARVISDLQNSD